MTTLGYTLFETEIGTCGLAWSTAGITGVQLPEIPPAEAAAALARRFPGAVPTTPPEPVRQAVAGIQALLRGEAVDLGRVALDLGAVPDFHRRIYDIARSIPPGATLTYGEIAARLGEPGAARAVGRAMGANPCPILMPCHRVLAAGGETGGFSAPGGVATKLLLLSIEGAAEAQGPFQSGPSVPSEPAGLFASAPVSPDFDPDRAIAYLRAVDPELARLIDRVGPLRLQLDQRSSLFAALAEAIIYQQLTAKAAAAIFGRVKALFKHSLDGPNPEQILHIADDKLRGAGLSRAKLLALRDLARRAAEGTIPTLAELRAMPDETIVERLTAVRGIGRWTVEMLLIFRLGRPDILPADDWGLRKGYALAFGGVPPTARELAAAGEAWRPFRTAASWYLWRASDPAGTPVPETRAQAQTIG
jgi:methylated-DNA-[protein]-cysteine S-methyltransferase